MAGWLDYLNQQAANKRLYRPPTGYRPSFSGYTPDPTSYNPYEVSHSSSSLFTSGSRAPGVAAPASPSAAAPERFDFSVPYSKPPGAPTAPVAPQDTQGDLLGSIGGALGSTTSGINMANAVPWLLERVHQLTGQVATDNKGSTVGDIAHGATDLTGLWMNGFEQASNVVAPILDALPNYYRDTQLDDRAKLYRAIVSGNEEGSFGPMGVLSSNTLIPGTYSTGDAYRHYLEYQQALKGSLLFGPATGEDRANVEKQIAILRDSVDLPESVKQAITASPGMGDDDLKKLLDQAPEGRQWSYDPGVSGTLARIGNPLLFYGSEAVGMSGLGAGASAAVNESLVPSLVARGAMGARTAAGITRAATVAGQVTTAAARIQKAYMLAGLGTTALTTGMDAIARYQGNEEAIAWFQKVNQPGEFAENPNVQLVSSFTVNPFEGAGLLKKGVVKLANGTGKVFLGSTLGDRLLQYHNSDSLVYGQLAKMYRLSGPDEAKAFAHDKGFYDNKGEVFDEVVGLAADHVLETKLPREERMAFLAAHPDPVDMTKTVLSTYGPQIMDALQNHSDEIAQRWFQRSWEYHQYPGAFQPEVAALNARDFRLAKAKTFDLRQQVNAVVGYQEFMPPEAVGRARQWLDSVAKDGRVQVAGRDGVQDLVRQFPAMRKYWQGIVKGGDKSVPKEAVETMIQRAERDYSSTTKQNPVRVRTGADPVIRPDSPRRDLDYAEAFGTDVATVKALGDFNSSKPDAAGVNLLRTFVQEKLGIDPEVAAKLAPEEVWSKAADYFSETAAPWERAGERVVAAEKQIASLRGDLVRLRAMDPRLTTLAHKEATTAAETQLQAMMTLVREAGDPIVPFADEIGFERMAGRNADRVRQMDPMRLTPAQETFLHRYVMESGDYTSASLKGQDLWNAASDVASRAPKVTGVDAALAARATRKVEAIAILDELSTIDDAAGQLGLPADSSWTNLIRRNPEGEWSWSGGTPPMSLAMRTRMASWLRGHGRGGTAREMTHMGDAEAWNLLVRQHPEAMESLTRPMRTQVSRMIADTQGKLGNISTDEYAQAAIDRGEVTSTDQFLERLYALADQRESILERTGQYGNLRERNLIRRASIDVPPDYVHEAQANLESRSLYYDPEFQAVIHPQSVAQATEILNNPAELYSGLPAIVSGDPILEGAVERVAVKYGTPYENVLRDPTYAAALKQEMVPADYVAPEPGLAAETELDALVLSDDGQAIAARSGEIAAAADGPHEPITTTVSRAQRSRPVRPTSQWRERLATYGADLTAAPNPAILDAPANRVGLDALSIINHGVVGARPATVNGVLHILASIEKGNGVRIGLGAKVQAEGQRVANEILADAVNTAKRSPFVKGAFGPGLDPASFALEEWTLARELPIQELRADLERQLRAGGPIDVGAMRRVLSGTLSNDQIVAGREAVSQRANAAVGDARGAAAGTGGAMREAATGAPRSAGEAARTGGRIDLSSPELQADLRKSAAITYEPSDPLGSLQYGFKKRPKDAVVLELSRVPGLAEEFVTNRFQPWQERVWTARARQAYNYAFGPLANGQVAGGIRQRFVERLARHGVDGELADAIWKRWKAEADNSRDPELRIENGARKFYKGDNPLYASVGNIPNMRMDQWAHEVVDDVLNGRNAKGLLDKAYLDAAHSIDYSSVFREASSFTRRNLMDLPAAAGHKNLGEALATAYGKAFHNKAITTMYYWFRFGLDVRYHAMNFFESQLLYMGRAGLRKGEIDTGMLGQTEGFLRKMDQNFIDNTGYATSRSRFGWAYRTFLKEQPDALRGQLKGLQAEDPALLEQAAHELADTDPALRGLIRDMGDTPNGWLKAMDQWHGKLLDSVTEHADGSLTIDQELANEIAKTPAMAEVYGALSKQNADLWGSVRDTFYGNSNRTRAERFLNSYLLFWPLSYQVKSSRWLMRVLFDRAGGLPTNAAGAVILDRAAAAHQQLLQTDKEYQDWYEKHPTMAFVAQMLMPITPDSMGVSLNPIMRSVFFGRTKAFWDVGPIYTVNHVVQPGMQELGADLYPLLKDVPGMDGLYRTISGKAPKASWTQD